MVNVVIFVWTYAQFAICDVDVDVVAVGAVGVPENAGDANNAYDDNVDFGHNHLKHLRQKH